MAHYAYGRPKDHCKKPRKDAEQGQDMRGEFVQLGCSDGDKNRGRSPADEQRKFTPNRATELLRVFRLPNGIRFCKQAPEHIGWAGAMQSGDAFVPEHRTGPALQNYSDYLTARNCADDQKWFCSVRNCIRQLRIW